MNARSGLRWWMPFLLAVQFLTRIPVPGLNGVNADIAKAGLSKSVIWFPVVGGLIGGVTACTLMLAEQFWPRVVAVIVALIVEARLTGAFHEDGVADFCDGFGGGVTPERIHTIMKDSRIGAYGAVGLGLAISLRAILLVILPAALIVPALLASASFGRWLAVALMALIPPLQMAAGSRRSLAKDVGTQTSKQQLLTASLLSLPFIVPFAFAAPAAMLGALMTTAAFTIWLRAFLLRHLGGVTGDCLGFAAYAAQLIVLLAATATL